MLSFRYRIVETAGADGTPRWAVYGVGHDDADRPTTLAGEAVAVACSDDGMAPADSLRAQLEAIMAALDEPVVKADELSVDGAGVV